MTTDADSRLTSDLSDQLGPLPKPDIWVREDFGLGDTTTHIGYNEEQMRAYAVQAVQKERERARVLVLAAVHHAVNACASATGQHRVIGHFVNKLHIANEVMVAVGSEA